MRVLALSAFASIMTAIAQEKVTVTEVTPTVMVFGTRTGNVVASIGADGALLVGTPSAGSTREVSRIVGERTKSPLRYVVISPETSDSSEGDAKWGQEGAMVLMQESALERIGGHAMGPASGLPAKLRALGVDRPRVSFSEVVSFDMNGESVHIVRQTPGFSDADAIVHFHVAHLVYLGEVFPGDGYPLIDTAQGGTLVGLLKTLGSWTGDRFRVVPARGDVTTGDAVEAFRTMIQTVRGRIRRMVEAGQTEQQILAAHPTAEFDAQWGHGRVSPDTFTREIYSALTAPPPAKQ
jgi:cyclase